MANWCKKYYYSFKDLNELEYRVEIYEDVPQPPIPLPLEVIGAASPCKLVYNNDHLFNPVWGSGAELSLISTYNQMFNNLYTDDMMKYQVRVYKTVWITPIYSVEMPVWFGYLDSENYSEDFSKLNNYEVNLTANDGFNLLNRMYYLNTNITPSIKYTGIKTQWSVIINILKKIALPYNHIYVGLSTTPLDYVLQNNETIFHKIFSNNKNWYNEDDESETCRTVLENILKAYGAFIIQKGGDLYITDINHIAEPSASFKKYEFDTSLESEFTYITTVSKNLLFGDISSIGVKSDNIQFNVENGINKQVVNYNQYEESELLNFDTKKDLENQSVSSFADYGSTYYRWRETTLTASDYLNSYNNAKFCKLKGLLTSNEDKEDYYLKIPNRGLIGATLTESTSPLSYTVKGTLPTIIPSGKYFLKLDMKVYFRTLQDLNNPDEVIPKGISRGELCCRVQIGTKKYIYPNQWVDINSPESLVMYFVSMTSPYDINPLNDKWKELALDTFYYLGSNWTTSNKPYLIPITSDMITGGELYFDIYGYKAYEMPVFPTNVETTVEDMRIKDIKITVVDSNGIEVGKSDLEYISKLNSNFANEGQKVTLYQGTNVTEHPCQRANLLVYVNDSYTYSTGLNKEGDTDLPENLLLRSIKSNYGSPNVKLAINLPINNELGYYTYNNYLAGKKLFPISNTLNLVDDVSELTLREIHKDEAIIL